MSHIEHLRKHANWYARRGLRVFPCKPRDKVPATAHGCKDATTDPAQIAAWWDGTYLYNVGLATGGGVVVLDVDINHSAGKYGDETLAELEAIHEVCQRWRLPLFVDGARLACGLAASDVTLPDLARLCDAFYLGGTKAGLLFGEAVVIPNPALNHDFRYLIKQHGGMLAKGRLLGVQFEAFLKDGLFLEIGRQEVAQAMRLREAFLAKGWPLFVDSSSNQQFPVLTNGDVAVLRHKYSFEVWEKVDQAHTAVRFCTSWSTTDEDVDALISDIQRL